MSRKSVRAKFVGSEDVVEHMVSKSSKTRRKSSGGVLMGLVVEEGGDGGVQGADEEDYILHRMSKELIDSDYEAVAFRTPVKSSRRSFGGGLRTPSRSGVKVNFTESRQEEGRGGVGEGGSSGIGGNFTPRSILKRRSIAVISDLTSTTQESDSGVARRTSRRSVMTPSKPTIPTETLRNPTPGRLNTPLKSLSTPFKPLLKTEKPSTPSKKSSSTPSKTSSSTLSKKSLSTPSKTPYKTSSSTPSKTSLSTPSKTSLSRTLSSKTTRSTTTPSKPPPVLPRKTPRRLRKRNDVDESSSSDSEIEYEEDDEEEDTDDDKDNDDDDDDAKKVSQGSRAKLRLRKDVEHDDIQRHAVEEYFHHHHKTPATSTTSNHTIHSKLEAHEVNSLMLRSGKAGKGQQKWLMQYHSQSFPLYYYLLMQGYNILFHGLGSKMKLMSKFQRRFLSDYSCVSVNGFFPGLTFKNIIVGLMDVLGAEASLPASSVDQVRLVKEASLRRDNPDIFLLINNIDGFNLRNNKHQLSLSLLCLVPGIHVVASVDHINSPLLWDQTKLQRLNWLWFEVTSFETYASETAHENCLLVQQTGILQLSSLSHIMRSLTANARGIFRLLCRYQMDNGKDPTYQGLPFSDLYMKSREGFLVNSEPTLRAQLVEFKDHSMIRTKKGLDGVDYVSVSIDNTTLTTFLEQLN